ncbi:hypothetical protein OSTOST_18789, partial [Ostertagia ostertagi]
MEVLPTSQKFTEKFFSLPASRISTPNDHEYDRECLTKAGDGNYQPLRTKLLRLRCNISWDITSQRSVVSTDRTRQQRSFPSDDKRPTGFSEGGLCFQTATVEQTGDDEFVGILPSEE